MRMCDKEERWNGRKRYAMLHRWSEKGGYIIWLRFGNEEEKKGVKRKMVSKAITDVDFAREWGVEVNIDLDTKARGKRVKVDCSSVSVGRIKRQRSIEVTSKLREEIDEMAEDVQVAIMASIKDVEMGEVAGLEQPPTKI